MSSLPQLENNFQTSYNSLNSEQKLAVDTIDGPVMVVAGPGTGKTQLLATRIANILHQTDTLGSSILCLTFTDNATVNLRKRLNNLIGSQSYQVGIYTFHSFCTEIINQYPEFFFNSASFHPLDELSKIEILEEIFTSLPLSDPLASFHPDQGWVYLSDTQTRIFDLKDAGLTSEEFRQILEDNQNLLTLLNPIVNQYLSSRVSQKPKFYQEFIHKITQSLESFSETNLGFTTKLNFVSLKQYLLAEIQKLEELCFSFEKMQTIPISAFKKNFLEKDGQGNLVFKDFLRYEKYLSLAKVYRIYQEKLHIRGFFDFQDMQMEVVKAIEQNNYLKENLQEKYQYILVDEFQDTSGVQLRLLDGLISNAPENSPNILVVGDDDQTVFKFQKASIQNMLGFKNKLPKTRFITLTKNYRSTQEILNFAAKVIEKAEVRLTSELNLDKNLQAMK